MVVGRIDIDTVRTYYYELDQLTNGFLVGIGVFNRQIESSVVGQESSVAWLEMSHGRGSNRKSTY